MKKNKTRTYCILSVVIILAFQRGLTQQFVVLPNDSTEMIGNYDLSDSVVVDTAFCVVRYDLSFVYDTLRNSLYNNRFSLDIGHKFTRFYNVESMARDLNYTLFLAGKPQIPYPNSNQPLADLNILVENKTGLVTTYHHMSFMDNRIIAYTETRPDLHWIVTDDRRTLFGFECWKAECDFAGRHWTAWFAPSISLGEGPWKLRGLPGLILEAADSGKQYVFTCCGIAARTKPINKYGQRVRLMLKKKWTEIVRRSKQHPVLFYDDIKFFIKEKAGDETWSIPYNPIERE